MGRLLGGGVGYTLPYAFSTCSTCTKFTVRSGLDSLPKYMYAWIAAAVGRRLVYIVLCIFDRSEQC